MPLFFRRGRILPGETYFCDTGSHLPPMQMQQIRELKAPECGICGIQMMKSNNFCQYIEHD